MSAMWTIKRGRIVAASVGVLSAWACTVADKGDYTFTDNPEGTGGTSAGKGGSSSAGKGTGGTSSGEAGMTATGGTGARGGRGSGGRATTGGRGGKAGTGGAAGESGAAGEAGVSGTGGNAGQAGESGAGGEAGATPVNHCGDGHLDAGEQCDQGANNGVTACTYGQTSCTVCTSACKHAAGTATYCGDGQRQSAHEQCDDGNTVTEGCTYGDATCATCDATCKSSSPRVCGDDTVNGDVITSITLESVGVFDFCGSTSASAFMPFYLNGVPIPNAPQSLCGCTSTVASSTITDTAVLAAVSPTSNVFEVRHYDTTDTSLVSWVRLTFNYADGTTFAVTPIDGGQASTNGINLCQDYQFNSLRSAAFDVPRVEQCDGAGTCASCGYPAVVPGFTGDPGPAFEGWTQCEGYLDTAAGDELPATGWAAACAGQSYNSIRLACGPSLQAFRYLDVNKNIFRDGVTGFPETDLTLTAADQSGVAFTPEFNGVWATAPVDSNPSWWGADGGCEENVAGVVVDPASSFGCAAPSWEVSDCFGQNLTGDRHLWIYVK